MQKVFLKIFIMRDAKKTTPPQKKRKEDPIPKVSSKLGVMDEEMEGEASELILFIFILKLLYNYSIYYSFLL